MDDPAASDLIKPEGLALATFVTSIIFSVLCTLIVLARICIRFQQQRIGSDDQLMAVGWLAYMVHNALVAVGCHRGIGTEKEKLGNLQAEEAMKYVFLWQILYALTLVFVKSSICVTVLRIATGKFYVWTLRALIGLSVLMSSVGLVVIMVQCRPVEAFWKKSSGSCMDKILPTVLTYAASVANVITDLTVAVIPICLVRKLQMRSCLKRYAQCIMGLGVLASIASIVRVPYSNAYLDPSNFLYHVANIIIWTVVECGVGIIAGSLPSLRAVMKSLNYDKSTRDNSESTENNIMTIGRIRDRRRESHSIELTTNMGDMDKADRHDPGKVRGINITRTFTIERTASDEQELCGDGRYNAVARWE